MKKIYLVKVKDYYAIAYSQKEANKKAAELILLTIKQNDWSYLPDDNAILIKYISEHKYTRAIRFYHDNYEYRNIINEAYENTESIEDMLNQMNIKDIIE